MKKQFIKISFFILFFSFLIFSISFCDIIRVSEDVNPNYKKDFNGDGQIVIVLDPGHGTSANVVNRSKYFYSDKEEDIIYENVINLKLAKLLREELKNLGINNVYLTREENVDVSLQDRGVIAKYFNADLMISIHFNSMPTMNQTTKAMGVEIWQSVIDMYKPFGLAKCIFKELNKNHFLQIIRGLKERVSGDTYWDYNINNDTNINNGNEADYYGVIKSGARNFVPTIIVEHAFFTNDIDFKIMTNENNYQEIAKREAKAIYNWLNE